MPLSYDAAERLFQTGQLQELVASTRSLDFPPDTSAVQFKVLVAHALALVGNTEDARHLLQPVTRTTLPALLRSRAELVLGLISEGEGMMSDAFDHYQASVRYAHTSQDDMQIAWAHLRLLRHLIDRGSNVELAGVLAQARNAATRAASPHVSAYLHLSVAVQEGQSGRLDEARRHCDIADSLLRAAPNAWIASGITLNRSCLAALECKFDEAAAYLLAATQAADGKRGAFATCNLAHCQILTGQFAEAQDALSRVLASPNVPALAVVGAWEGFARLHLILGRLEECESVLGRIDDAVIKDRDIRNVYHVRWATLTKARFLLKSNRTRDSLELLQAAAHDYASLDVPLTAAIQLTAAQAYAKLGEVGHALKSLRLAAARSGSEVRDLQGLYYFSWSTVLNVTQSPLAAIVRERALRVWSAEQNAALPRELDDGLTLQPSAKVEESKFNKELAIAEAWTGAVDSIAAAMDLAHTPKLLGAELLNLITATKCSLGARLVELPAGRTDAISEKTAVTIPLGITGQRRTELVCPIPESPGKSLALDAISRIACSVLALQRAKDEERKRAALWPADHFEGRAEGALFISDEMQSLLATARRVATTNVPVLITGETGTGKEVLARTIHAYSARARAAFIPFNCTSTPKDMLDSQLFGHRRGSFTGAVDNFQGIIRTAGGGTLFLDEIGDMPLEAQPKLLRFLESGEVHPVGDAQPLRADVRVIAATNANLDALVTDGRFREDLFYRLNIVQLHLPPLRERRMEIPALASHYLEKFAREYAKGDLRLAEETMEYLLLYRWPGNVRQLANEMRRMAALCEAGAVLMPEHLSADLAASRRTVPPSARVLAPTEVVVRLDQPLPAATEHLERAMLQYALDKCGGRMEETAALLGLSRKGLYLKRHRFGIETPGARSAAGAA